MSGNIEFYLTQADECARNAEKTVLENVRERHLRSEQAWRALAGHLLRTEQLRSAREAQQQQQRATEVAEA